MGCGVCVPTPFARQRGWHPQEPGTARVNRAKTRDNLKNYLQFTKRWLKGNSFGQFPISRLFGSWQPDRKELGGVGAIHPALLVTRLGSRNGQGEEISGPSEGHLSLTRGLTGSLIMLPCRQSEDSWEARRNEQLDRKSSIAVGAVPWPADPRTRMSSLMRWRRGVMGKAPLRDGMCCKQPFHAFATEITLGRDIRLG